MTFIWIVLTNLAISSIYIGNTFYEKGKRQLGIVLILIGLFQLLGELIANL